MALSQALAFVRFPIFVAALEWWVFRDSRQRRWFAASLTAAALYVAAQTLLQFTLGRNLFGTPRYADGSLTGPFVKPRAGPTFVRMLFPALLPPFARLLERANRRSSLAALALILVSVGVVVLIGQRIPVLLTVLGLLVAALFNSRMRVQVAIAIIAAAALIAASSIVAPPTFYRLVTKFSQQMENFATGPYGALAERSLAITEQHPWTGRGYDGFRSGCPQPRYFVAWHWPGAPAPGADPAGAENCTIHPHNFFLQVATDSGLPGLTLFCALAGLWLRRLAAGLIRSPVPLRVGLFVAALIQLWPFASTGAMQSIPVGAWFFLLLGYGLAEARFTGASLNRGVKAVPHE